jgi:uncharacterized protein YllA (UPF0747 family)
MSSSTTYTTPDTYTRTLDDIMSSTKVVLNNLSTPADTSSSTIIDTAKKNSVLIQDQLQQLEKEVDAAYKGATTISAKKTEEIDDAMTAESDLNKKIHALENSNSGAAGIRKNMTDTYKLQYASNFFLFIGLLLGIYLLYIVFGKDIVSGSVSIAPTM